MLQKLKTSKDRLGLYDFILSLIFILIFTLFIIFHNSFILEKVDTQLARHGNALSAALWNIDWEASLSYLKLASQADGYKSISIIAFGMEQQTVQGSDLTSIESLLFSLKLIPLVTLESPVLHDDEIIGILKAQWYNRSIYIYANVFIVLLLLYSTISFLIRSIAARNLLEIRVEERTKDLQEEILKGENREKEIADSEKKFRSYVESTPIGVFVTDERGNYLEVNKAAEKITGYSRKELLSMNISDLTPQEDQGRAIQDFKKMNTTGETYIEIAFLKKDGSHNFWAVTANKLAENRFLGFAIDITEKQQTEEKLRQSQKMDALGQLAGGISHDINNMLTGIIGAAELIRPALQDNDEMMEYHTLLIESVQRASDLTGNLLGFARKRPIVTQQLDIHHVLEKTVSILNKTLDKGIEIRTELNAATKWIMGDESQLQNIFMNLGINASHAMPRGGVLTFRSENCHLSMDDCKNSTFLLTPGTYIKLNIEDTGQGIPERDIDRIFEPFFTTKPSNKGTGMGLSTSFGTIQKHSGSITVSSKVGQGSNFQILLPVKEIK